MCSTRLSFAVDDKEVCYNYNITQDPTCEVGNLQTYFLVRLTLFTDDEEIHIDLHRRVANVTIDDSAEPECCKFQLKRILVEDNIHKHANYDYHHHSNVTQ